MNAPTTPATSLLGIKIKGLRILESWVKQKWEAGSFKAERKFPDGTVCLAVDRYEEITTTHVVYCLIQDESLTKDKRLAECSDIISNEYIARPTYFVSHAWKGLFHRLIDGVMRFLYNASDSTAVWIDWLFETLFFW